MFAVGTSECLVNARLDTAFGLTADRGQLRDDKIAGTFEHSLFAKRKRLEIA
jgi:hypothetical protein